MAELTVDELLARLPEIAQAVNAFKSESVQQQVVTTILDSLKRGRLEQSTPQQQATDTDVPSNPASAGKAGSRRKTAQRGPTRQVSPSDGEDSTPIRGRKQPLRAMRDLDLKPANKQSLAQLVEEKAPKSMAEQVTVAIYYLQHVAEISPITPGHVYTCFRAQGWRQSTDLRGLLSVVSSRNGYIQTNGMLDLQLTSKGENLVNHDLPAPK